MSEVWTTAPVVRPGSGRGLAKAPSTVSVTAELSATVPRGLARPPTTESLACQRNPASASPAETAEEQQPYVAGSGPATTLGALAAGESGPTMGGPNEELALLALLRSLKKGRGLTIIGRVLIGEHETRHRDAIHVCAVCCHARSS